ncbi:MAG: heavy metal-binding domain-containing protein [Brevundimonas sp.]
MKIAPLASLLATLPLVASCGAMVAIEDASGLSAAQQALPIRQDADLRGGRIVGLVEGHSCKNKAWDPAPSRADADRQLRLQATRLGGNAIVSVRYESRGVTVQPNCWSSITAYGTVVASSD